MKDAIAFGLIFSLAALSALGASVLLIVPAALALMCVSPADPIDQLVAGRLSYAAVSFLNAGAACAGAYAIGAVIHLLA